MRQVFIHQRLQINSAYLARMERLRRIQQQLKHFKQKRLRQIQRLVH